LQAWRIASIIPPHRRIEHIHMSSQPCTPGPDRTVHAKHRRRRDATSTGARDFDREPLG
jgi:hypothetical protein